MTHPALPVRGPGRSAACPAWLAAVPAVLWAAAAAAQGQALGPVATAAAAPAASASATESPSSSLDPALAERVRQLLAPSVPAAAGRQARVEFEVGRLDPRLRLAPCRRIDTQLPPQAPMWGRTRVTLKCVEGDKPWQVYLPVTVKVFAPALVPVRPLTAGSVIAAGDLQLAEVDWAAEAQPPHTRADALIGRTLARPVAAGQAVRVSDLRLRQHFAAGDTVQLVARGAGFAVSGEGQALGPGVEGQPARVRTESGRVLTGTVTGDYRVEVAL